MKTTYARIAFALACAVAALFFGLLPVNAAIIESHYEDFQNITGLSFGGTYLTDSTIVYYGKETMSAFRVPNPGNNVLLGAYYLVNGSNSSYLITSPADTRTYFHRIDFSQYYNYTTINLTFDYSTNRYPTDTFFVCLGNGNRTYNPTTTDERRCTRLANTSADMTRINIATEIPNANWSDINTADEYFNYLYFIYISTSGSGVDLTLIDNINIEINDQVVYENVTPIPPPNVSLTYTTIFNETFGTTPTTINECQSVCGEKSCLQIYSTGYLFDNYWYCWKNIPSVNLFNGQTTNDTTKIDTPMGLRMYSANVGYLGASPIPRKMVALTDSDLFLTANTTIAFTCTIPDQATQIDAYLYLGKSGPEEGENNSVMISLGGTPSGCGILGLPTTQCCALGDIVGTINECNATKKRVEFSVEQLLDSCPQISSADLNDISQVGLYAMEYGGQFFNIVGYSYIWLDDILIRDSQGLVVGPNGTDYPPTIVSVLPNKNPVNVSEAMYWLVGWANDNVPSHNNTYVAFSCGGNATLDYPYGNYDDYGVAPFTYRFNCSYNQEGTFTPIAYITDVTYQSLGINNTGAGVVDVALTSAPYSPDCEGFIPPSCTGNCWFYDDFYYNNNLVCNGWNGTLRAPTAGVFKWDNPLAGEEPKIRAFDINKSVIRASDIAKFNVSFDFKSDNNLSNVFYIRGENGEYSVYLDFRAGRVRVGTYYPTGLPYLFYYNLSEWQRVDIEVDLIQQRARYQFTNQTQSFVIPFLDISAPTASEFVFSCTEINCDFTLDNFNIELVEQSYNVSYNTIPSNYSYNPDLFCAINWTAAPGQRKFVEQNCADRGFGTHPNLIGLCIPRACVQDVGFALYNAATGNILQTIIVAIVVILVAPLAIALIRRR